MKAAKGKGTVKKDKKEVLKPVDDRQFSKPKFNFILITFWSGSWGVGKRKAVAEVNKSSGKLAKNSKSAKKDPNKPKKPASAFFVFLEEFRITYKQEHPNVKAVSAVGKAGGAKWKSMSAAEKAPYEAKAAKRKTEYEKLMNAYNTKQEDTDGDDDEEPEKPKASVTHEDEESGEEDDEDDDDEDDED
ncbi:putative chromatin remodeling & transcriptional activation HMG family [Rosa chinensis]|uniref:Putative chromatin remodeling & transcriptional activation HMG family n=1 Tax=Rosa chinensis TaxID=74649 RepID=A0A2P6SL63_ROSCH|nr:putative chromatin remodeling & transcriptional activation HMG family [Rosa chinensis]